MRRATLLLLLAACGGGRSAPAGGPVEAALEAFGRGEFDRADAILGGARDAESVLVRARLRIFRNRSLEAVPLLAPLALTKPRPGEEQQAAEFAHSYLATAHVRTGNFLEAAKTYAWLGEEILARKFQALIRNVGYLSDLGAREAAAALVRTEPVPIVDGSVNGAPGRFMIDTGLDEVVLDRDFARRARVTGIGLRTTELRRSYGEAVLDEMTLGGLRVRNVPARLGELTPVAAVKVDGAVGLAFLMHFDFTLDFRRSRLTFRRPGGAVEGLPALWAGDYLLVRGTADGNFESFIALHTGLAGVAVSVSPNLLALRPEPLQLLAAGPLRLAKPATDVNSFPSGLEASFGLPVGFALGPAALRGRSLRVEPKSMRVLIE